MYLEKCPENLPSWLMALGGGDVSEVDVELILNLKVSINFRGTKLYPCRLIYGNYFGGVTALTKEQFEDINGFSNSFYGWGGEDDDLFHRVTKKGYAVFRYPGNIGRYSMLKHDKVDLHLLI